MKFFGALVFICATFACIGHITARTEMRATDEVCDLIRENYYRLSDVREFLRSCEEDSVPFTYTRARAIEHLNRKLANIKTSHLSIYSPAESRLLWENEGSDTGIRARLIDGEMVISGTLEESPARKAQLRAGDVVVAVNGETPRSVQDVQVTAGEYKIARGSETFLTSLKPVDLKEDLSPSVTSVGEKAAVLKIPSFLPGYFERSDWLETAKNFEGYHALIIDLRDNPGGSFPAMLRALSPFRCGKEKVGEIWRTPRGGGRTIMRDELSVQSQLDQIAGADAVELRTFGRSYGCFTGHAIVLINSGTSSVAEIFAQALSGVPGFQVWGSLSAGQVVAARWFPIGSLGGDYEISIPIAGYRSADGTEIEGVGVRPQAQLFDELEIALRGEDSWIHRALEAL